MVVVVASCENMDIDLQHEDNIMIGSKLRNWPKKEDVFDHD